MNYSFDVPQYKKFLRSLDENEWYLFFYIDYTEKLSKYQFKKIFLDYREEKLNSFDEVFENPEHEWQEDIIERCYKLLLSQKNAALSLLIKANTFLDMGLKVKNYVGAKETNRNENCEFKKKYFKQNKGVKMFKSLILIAGFAGSSFLFPSEMNIPIHRETGLAGVVRSLYEEEGAWGISCSINLTGCIDLPKCRESAKKIHEFSHRLVSLIKMQSYGCPRIVWFGNGDKEGYTMVQLINTSSIVAHFAGGNIYLDVFSCKPYEPALVANFAADYFQAKEWSIVTNLR